MSWAIRTENLSKSYQIRHGEQVAEYRTLREDLLRILAAPWHRLRGTAGSQECFWALKDFNLEVREGELVGIIGRNGAGKSTLLKLLSRITKPTSGIARLRGRVGSLLEVSTGFHPELSGRENIFLSGAILGMSRHEVRRKFDEIVDFAGIENFLDTPAKRYSSGMYVRLGFAVAAHFDPEILLVDEVLSVGDFTFRKKCLEKMSSVARDGRTVIIVSHDLQTVSTLASRCVVLDQGRCSFSGPTAEAVSQYLQSVPAKGGAYRTDPDPARPCITRVELKTSPGGATQYNGEALEILAEIATPSAIDGASLSVKIVNELNQPVVHVWAFDSERPLCREAGRHQLRFVIPKLRLFVGHYTLNVFFAERPGGQRFEFLQDICPFEVHIHKRKRDWGWPPGSEMYLEDYDWSVSVNPAAGSPSIAKVAQQVANGVGSPSCYTGSTAPTTK